MITVELKGIDKARFSKAITELVKLGKKPVEQVMREQGRLFAVDAALFTQRFGDNKSHGDKHKERIVTDIQRVYKPAKWAAGLIGKVWGSSAAKRFAKFHKARNMGAMQDMIDRANLSSRFYGGRRVTVSMWDGGAAHTRFEKRRLKGNNPVTLIVNYAGNVTRFRKMKQKQVGALKSGWAVAAKGLGKGGAASTRGIPAYVHKGHKARGHGSVKGKGHKTILTVTNRSNYIIGNTSAVKLWRLRTVKIEAVIEDIIERRQKKIKRRLKV